MSTTEQPRPKNEPEEPSKATLTITPYPWLGKCPECGSVAVFRETGSDGRCLLRAAGEQVLVDELVTRVAAMFATGRSLIGNPLSPCSACFPTS